MRKLRIKLQLRSIIILFLAYFLLLANSWAQATEATKPEVKGEIKNDATSNDQNQKPSAPDGGLIGNLISSHLTDDSLLSKSIASLNSLNNSGSNAQEGATTKIINKASSVITDAIGGKKAVSLMYDPDELSGIENAIDALKNDRVYAPTGQDEDSKKPVSTDKGNARSYIYLGSILYFGPKNWVVWIDGKKVTYESNKAGQELYLTSVTNSDVGILWTMSISKWKILSGKKNEDLAPKVNSNNQIEIKFSLKSNQTYSLRSGNVTEGFQVPESAPATKDKITNSQAPASPPPSN